MSKCVPTPSYQFGRSDHEITIILQVDSIINKLLLVGIHAWLLFLFARILRSL